MRANEFLPEDKQGKLHKDQEDPMKTAIAFRDDGTDRGYNLNRVMMAAAMADGKSKKPVKMDAGSWTAKNNTVHPYTEEEHNMVHQAFGAVNSQYHDEVSDHHSKEPETTHRTSPVKGFKGYPR